MNWNPVKFISFLICLILWILLALFVVGCASSSKIQGEEGWFPVGMTEDSQDFYNSKYNMMDNGKSDPNINAKIFTIKF